MTAQMTSATLCYDPLCYCLDPQPSKICPLPSPLRFTTGLRDLCLLTSDLCLLSSDLCPLTSVLDLLKHRIRPLRIEDFAGPKQGHQLPAPDVLDRMGVAGGDIHYPEIVS